MPKSNPAQRIAQMKLDLVESKPVSVAFDGAEVSGNGGLLLISQVEKLTGLIAGAVQRMDDHRTASLIKHNHFELVAQRVFQIVAGFSAADDSDFLRQDPALKTAVGREALYGEDLSSQPTQSRLENGRSWKELYRLSQWLVDYYISSHKRPPKRIVLDFDGSAIETFGLQLQAFYRSGPYQKFMYFPLFVFDEHGWLLVAALRPGDEGEVRLALPVLKKLVAKLRNAWPLVRILVRADGAFTNKEFYRWMDDNSVLYALGLKHNNVLLTKSREYRRRAEALFKRRFEQPLFTGKQRKKKKLEMMKTVRSIANPLDRHISHRQWHCRRSRVYGEFFYQANSWDRERRVICRCDYTDEGIEVRYIVTNIKGSTASLLYEDLYCRRALAELSIKNLKETRCTRLSCQQFKSNMFRLLLHALAYLLILEVRRRLSPHLQRISFHQFRRLFINVAVHVSETNDCILFRFPRSYSEARHFRLASKRLGGQSLLTA